MKRFGLAPDEYYHICNRGVEKKSIFNDADDYRRFLFLILYFQSSVKFPQVGRLVKEFVEHRMLDIADKVLKNRTVELVGFCIMPNHFHLIVKELEEGGISAYMQRVLNAYGKYHNTKYGKSGHVFQGSYRLVHIEDDRQILHLSAYIHRNPREMATWLNKEDEYPWSSYQDFINNNRWEKLLLPDIVLDQFKDIFGYRKFVKTSLAKASDKEFEYLENF